MKPDKTAKNNSNDTMPNHIIGKRNPIKIGSARNFHLQSRK